MQLTIVSVSFTKRERADKKHFIINFIKWVIALFTQEKAKHYYYLGQGELRFLGKPPLKLYEIVTAKIDGKDYQFKVNSLVDQNALTEISSINVLMDGVYHEDEIEKLNGIQWQHATSSEVPQYL